jgi:toxin secretion/phage lysis holin
MTENAITDTLIYTKYLLSVAFHPTVIKTIWTVAYICATFLFDINQSVQLISLFILVLLDFVSGVSASVYTKEPIRSSKIKHTAIKLTAYFAVIAGAHLAENGLSHYFAVLDETVTAFFLLTELVSLLENIGRLGVDTPKGLIQKLLDYKNKI